MDTNKMWCKSTFSFLNANAFYKDANVHMMHMSPFRDANAIFMMQMSFCKNAMMQMLWCKHNLFKNSLCFQIEASSAPETKIFSKLDLLFLKSHLLFDLRLLKIFWWSLLENLRMGHWLGIWWSGSKDLFSQFGWAKGWHVSKAFFWKNEFFENQAS